MGIVRVHIASSSLDIKMECYYGETNFIEWERELWREVESDGERSKILFRGHVSGRMKHIDVSIIRDQVESETEPFLVFAWSTRF